MLKIACSARCEVLDGMEKYFCNAYYVDAFKLAGGELMMVTSISLAKHYAKACDALLIPGGNDMDSHYYHEPLHPMAVTYTRDIDDLDNALIQAFIDEKKPILGICRGLQVINVFFNGSLTQHFNTEQHIENKDSQPMHQIQIMKQSFLSKLYPPTIPVNSYHHQRIARLGDDLHIVGIHNDKTIEAIAHNTLPIWAVQWHPERLNDTDKIIPAFIQYCSLL